MSMSQCEFQILYHWSAFKVHLCGDEHHPSSEDTAKRSIGVNGLMGPEVIVGRPSWAETVLVRCGAPWGRSHQSRWFQMFLLVILGIWLFNYTWSWLRFQFKPAGHSCSSLLLRSSEAPWTFWGAESDYRSDRPTTARSAPIGARCASAELQDGCEDLVGHEGCDT